jgi:hypothetical protein
MTQHYALVNKANQIVVGPRDYRKSVFDRFLTDNGVDYELPDTYEDTTKLQINTEYRLIPVNYADMPSYESAYYQLAGPDLTVSASAVTATYSVAPIAIDTLKSQKLAKLAETRYNKEVSNMDFVLGDETVSVLADRESRSTIVQTLMLSSDTDQIPWKFASGFKIITKADLQAIAEAMKNHVSAAFIFEAQKQEEIQAANTIDDLKAIQDIEPASGRPGMGI